MIIFLTLLLTILVLSIPLPVFAVCPVCTVAVGVGVGLSRYLGIDDTISGLWIGGLILSSSLWLASFLRQKKFKTPFLELISVSLFYLLTVLPLYWTGIIGHAANMLWGIDKLLLGILVGSGLFGLSVGADKLLRVTNRGKVYIYYQRVILPISFLLIGSFIFYFITITK